MSRELASDPMVWLVVAILIASFVLRSAWFRGLWGEFKVRATTGLCLDGKTYRSLHNLTLSAPDGTTQVDHIIVSKFGVFVIESCGKAMVVRTAKRGPNAGGQFWGCSGFPQCRATKTLARR